MTLIDQNINPIHELCQSHHVLKLFAFGSVLTDKFRPESDVDLLVEFGNVGLPEYADNYFDLKYSLQNLLHREVDLLEEKALKNPYLKKSIDASKRIIYGR
jgi:uncharacterized protein